MFEEWETFFRSFTNALTLPSDSHSSTVYTNSFQPNPPVNPVQEYDESDDDMVLDIQHGLDDSE